MSLQPPKFTFNVVTSPTQHIPAVVVPKVFIFNTSTTTTHDSEGPRAITQHPHSSLFPLISSTFTLQPQCQSTAYPCEMMCLHYSSMRTVPVSLQVILGCWSTYSIGTWLRTPQSVNSQQCASFDERARALAVHSSMRRSYTILRGLQSGSLCLLP